MNSKELNEIEMKIITDSIDYVLDKYDENNKIIFTNESDRAKNHYSLINKNIKAWKKSKQCIVPNCTQRSIVRSHTIPRGMLLDSIAENGHIYTPEFSQNHGDIQMISMGVKTASTFPGFCIEHEKIFEEFETNKEIESERHIYLQTYRAACREFFRSSLLVKQCELALTSYAKLRDERLRILIKEEAIIRGLVNNASFNTLTVNNDPIVVNSEKRVSSLKNLSLHLSKKILPALERAVFLNNDDEIFIHAIEIDLSFPVALSGCASYSIEWERMPKEVWIIMNIIPNKNKTIFIFSGHMSDKEHIEIYISKWTENVFTLISMAESWMINGSDQWYVKLSIWDAIPQKRKRELLTDIGLCEQNIGNEYGLSIFDDLRTNMIEEFENKEKYKKSNHDLEFIQHQRAKMTS